ncbi:Mitochondrial intermembrane space cysteine motif-containing protein MIX17 [Vanrija pseudolonga]|uniref:Mitochondrial intermembrane space cysteine motif-containing protein MIX17 n=1 Tax=Vanrija pseudolonga TaxID=143232 RepID=A0AAF0Y6B0_9TREE|nr:Mitochondrial intermembrane space cysteine motif-containing protein MIX17 [Vanrija pseudolonga]
MPRSSGRSSARPSARPAPAAAPSGSRQASTAAYPAQHQAPPAAAYPAQQKQPGLMAQAASTMGGAVAGSVIGHGISNMLFGSSRPAEQAPPPAEYAQQQQQQQQAAGASCDIQAKDFTKCLEATNGDMNSCSYYLEALKACQAAARPY